MNKHNKINIVLGVIAYIVLYAVLITIMLPITALMFIELILVINLMTYKNRKGGL